MILNIIVLLITFVAMEGVAWFTHKYIMHGWFWFLHEDHHVPNNETVLEKNDYFFVIFAIPGILCTVLGSIYSYDVVFFIGIGITVYGAAYFLVHEVFIHQRLKWFRNSNSKYLRAIRRAHKIHHKHLGKADGECFGMLMVPFKYFREANKK